MNKRKREDNICGMEEIEERTQETGRGEEGRWVMPTHKNMCEAVTAQGAYGNQVKEGYSEQYKLKGGERVTGSNRERKWERVKVGE